MATATAEKRTATPFIEAAPTTPEEAHRAYQAARSQLAADTAHALRAIHQSYIDRKEWEPARKLRSMVRHVNLADFFPNLRDSVLSKSTSADAGYRVIKSRVEYQREIAPAHAAFLRSRDTFISAAFGSDLRNTETALQVMNILDDDDAVLFDCVTHSLDGIEVRDTRVGKAIEASDTVLMERLKAASAAFRDMSYGKRVLIVASFSVLMLIMLGTNLALFAALAVVALRVMGSQFIGKYVTPRIRKKILAYGAESARDALPEGSSVDSVAAARGIRDERMEKASERANIASIAIGLLLGLIFGGMLRESAANAMPYGGGHGSHGGGNWGGRGGGGNHDFGRRGSGNGYHGERGGSGYQQGSRGGHDFNRGTGGNQGWNNGGRNGQGGWNGNHSQGGNHNWNENRGNGWDQGNGNHGNSGRSGNSWGNNGGRGSGSGHGGNGSETTGNGQTITKSFNGNQGYWCPPPQHTEHFHYGGHDFQRGHVDHMYMRDRGGYYNGTVIYLNVNTAVPEADFYAHQDVYVETPTTPEVPPPVEHAPQPEYQKYDVVIRKDCNNILVVKEGGGAASAYDPYIHLNGAPLAHDTADIFKPESIQAEADHFAQSEGWSPEIKQDFIDYMNKQAEIYHRDPSHYFNDKPIKVGERFDAMEGRDARGEIEMRGEGEDKGVVMQAHDTSATHRFTFKVPVESHNPDTDVPNAESHGASADMTEGHHAVEPLLAVRKFATGWSVYDVVAAQGDPPDASPAEIAAFHKAQEILRLSNSRLNENAIQALKDIIVARQ